MKVIVTEPVEIALRSLGPEDRRVVDRTIENLRNWENDAFVAEHSYRLPPPNDKIQVYETSTDIRVFFSLENGHITIHDVARKYAILRSG